MPNNKSVGIAYSDPALDAGTTIDSAVINGGTIGATTPMPVTATTFTATTFTAATLAGARTTVAALGTDNTNAGVIPVGSFLCTVTAGDATKGVILPTMRDGQSITVKNNAAAVLKVYPFSGAAINGLTATTGSLNMAANTIATFFRDSSTQIWSAPLLPS